MGRKIRERIIRRLGGVPIWLFGMFPYPTDNWELRLLECRLEQTIFGRDVLEVKYEVTGRKQEERQ